MKMTLLRLICISSIATVSSAASPLHNLTSDEARARFLVMPKIDYPEIARRLHHTGTGVFGLYFARRGEVTGVRIFKSTGHKELDIAALKGFVQLRAKPGPKWWLKLPVTFSLTAQPYVYTSPYRFDYHF